MGIIGSLSGSYTCRVRRMGNGDNTLTGSRSPAIRPRGRLPPTVIPFPLAVSRRARHRARLV